MLLNCHSYFSLRYGALSEKEILETAIALGYDQVVLTDINSTSGCLNFLRLAESMPIDAHIGIDFRNGVEQQYVGIPLNHDGYLELNDFLSFHLHEKKEFPRWAPPFKNALVIYPYSDKVSDKRILEDHEYLGIDLNQLNRLDFIKDRKDKIVLLHSASFRHKRDYNTHRLLRAIDNNTLLSKLPQTEQASSEDKWIDATEMREKLSDFPEILSKTTEIINQCSLNFDFSDTRPNQNLQNFNSTAEQDIEQLKDLCQAGIPLRYGKISPAIQERIDKEINTIVELGFVSFFLVTWDILEYARSKGYYYVGRGSGANSIVAYLLRITDVDPIELDLYFERFMNLYRKSPPDFDIDFSWRDREDVTRYIFNKYGPSGRAALICTYNTFKYSAAIRELGKVFGLPKENLDKLSRGRYAYSDLDDLEQQVVRYSRYLDGKPNLLSVHAGGILISEKPIHHFTSTFLPPKGFPTTHFDMVIAEDVGLYKYDILGQRGLAKIKETIDIVRTNQPENADFDIHAVSDFKKDKGINDMIASAQCMGCFYVESPAMRMLLRKLSVDNYLGLVAASSIIRPGVAKSGMMREYILRHKYPERRKEAHPILQKIMPETYGIMVYQEDVIKVAHLFAGLSLSESDVLRRAMSGKYRGREEFEQIRDKFFLSCHQKGYDKKTVTEVWLQIESFAGYAFAKGHSASYAVESYQTLFLKHYYPLEYMTAVLNNGGGFYRPEIYLHEARMKGATIVPPDVNTSDYTCHISNKTITLGLMFVTGIDHETAFKIVSERKKNGAFTSLLDFVERVHIPLELIDKLVRIGAFRWIEKPKKELLWQAYHLKNHIPTQNTTATLFPREEKDYTIPQFQIDPLEEVYEQIEILGFPLTSPFQLIKDPPHSYLKASQLVENIGKEVEIYGYLVTYKTTKTKQGKKMNFGTYVDIEGHFIDTVAFPTIANKYPHRGIGIYRIVGKVVDEFGFQTIEVKELHKIEYHQDVRYTEE